MRKTGATAVLHTETQKGANARTITSTKEWNALKDHVKDIEKTHLRDLLKNYDRCENLTLEHDGVYVDYARQRVTEETMEKLYALAKASGVKEKINAMFSGNPINSTENRAVLHVATRAPRSVSGRLSDARSCSTRV